MNDSPFHKMATLHVQMLDHIHDAKMLFMNCRDLGAVEKVFKVMRDAFRAGYFPEIRVPGSRWANALDEVIAAVPRFGECRFAVYLKPQDDDGLLHAWARVGPLTVITWDQHHLLVVKEGDWLFNVHRVPIDMLDGDPGLSNFTCTAAERKSLIQRVEQFIDDNKGAKEQP